MAHFAELDENNIVKRVIVVSNVDTSDAFGVEKEYIGAAFCERLLGGRWKQTSYNHKFRGTYAGIGFYYSEDLDIFMPPKPHPSWIVDTVNKIWKAPVDMPTDGKSYNWNESTLSWDEAVIPET